MKHQPPFRGASEIMVEDREEYDASGAASGGTAAEYGNSHQSARREATASGHFGDSQPPAALNFGPLSRPASVHAPSSRSYQGSARSVVRLPVQQPSAIEDDVDDDSDDLYDPEFGIGGNGRYQRRNHSKLPSRLLTTQRNNPAVILSAAVISAAAAAVSAGWFDLMPLLLQWPALDSHRLPRKCKRPWDDTDDIRNQS
ncbi:hypothetical protein BGZ47_009574 [Haplosporangium gracile]|nr:hypothetical protein BGZ47_009574 [Haplosporangium gracile]